MFDGLFQLPQSVTTKHVNPGWIRMNWLTTKIIVQNTTNIGAPHSKLREKQNSELYNIYSIMIPVSQQYPSPYVPIS